MSALGVDTRSDIYSLGVLLYELLTGSTPLTPKRVKEAAYGEILRMIKEEEPPRPSTRLSDSGEALASISAQRHMEPAKLTKLVRGELDWIVMKTLEKDRNRRYETAKDFAADVQRYLNDEPVQACPPSAWYRFRKFARRNRISFVVGALGAAVVVLAALGLIVGLLVVDQERRQTLKEQARTKEALDAESRQRGLAEQRLKLAVEVLDEICLKEAETRTNFRGEPQLVSSIKDPVKERLERDFLEKGLRLYERLTEIDPADLGGQVKLASAFRRAAILRNALGLQVEAQDALDRATRLGEKLVEEHPGDPEIALDLALAYFWESGPAWGQAVDPESTSRRVMILRKALALFERVAAETGNPWAREGMGRCHQNLGLVFARPGRTCQAEPEYTQALAILEKLEADCPNLNGGWNRHMVGWTYELRAELFMGNERWDEAEKACQASIAVFKKMVTDFQGTNNLVMSCRRHLAENHAYLADVYQRTARLGESESARRQAIANWNALQEAFPGVSEYRGNLASNWQLLGNLLQELDRLTEAEKAFRTAAGIWEKLAIDSPDDPRARYLQETARLDAAIAAAREAIERDPKSALAHYNLGRLLHDQKKLPEGIASYRTAIELDPKLAKAHKGLGQALFDQHMLDEAVAEFRQAIVLDPKDAIAHNGLGAALHHQKKLPEAIACYRKAIDLHPEFVWPHNNLGIALWTQGRLDEAIACYRRSIELDAKSVWTQNALGNALLEKGQVDDAIAAYREAVRLKPDLAAAHYVLGLALKAKGDLDGAEGAYREAVRLDGKHHGDAIDALAELLLSRGNLKETIATYQKIIILDPKDASAHNRLAWLLATCPDPKLRDPKRVLELAKKALQLAPHDGESWKSLGAAHYCLGDWKATIAAFEKANTFFSGGGSNEWFFLAMAHWQLGEKDLARRAYDRAVQWMEKYHPKNRDLGRLRSEAARLLGVEQKKD
jgi:tetratricopeptide (TPR) repeat protein